MLAPPPSACQAALPRCEPPAAAMFLDSGTMLLAADCLHTVMPAHLPAPFLQAPAMMAPVVAQGQALAIPAAPTWSAQQATATRAPTNVPVIQVRPAGCSSCQRYCALSCLCRLACPVLRYAVLPALPAGQPAGLSTRAPVGLPPCCLPAARLHTYSQSCPPACQQLITRALKSPPSRLPISLACLPSCLHCSLLAGSCYDGTSLSCSTKTDFGAPCCPNKGCSAGLTCDSGTIKCACATGGPLLLLPPAQAAFLCAASACLHALHCDALPCGCTACHAHPCLSCPACPACLPAFRACPSPCPACLRACPAARLQAPAMMAPVVTPRRT